MAKQIRNCLQTKNYQMPQELFALKQSIIDHIVKYMNWGSADNENDPNYNPNFDSGYTQEHVNQCEELLEEFLASLVNLAGTSQKEQIMGAVKTVVLSLNKLNEACDRPLIETSEREQLCELIITAAKQAGLDSGEEDITEEWREW